MFNVHSFKNEIGDTSMNLSRNFTNEPENRNGLLPQGKHKRSLSYDILAVDMRYSTQHTLLRYAREAFQQHSYSSDVAEYIQNKARRYIGGTFQCVVGTSYGYSIIHNDLYYFYFKMNRYNILVFRTRA
ncbi:Hypothetical predicted protein [Mytilus galloprovincialis]|nr:Hypothetical predicted protein [Mytilus galloprovincialis]